MSHVGSAPVFLANRPFNAASAGWSEWRDRAGLPGVEEVVGLDCLLCPDVLREIADEDWSYVECENMRLRYFTDLDYLLGRLPERVEMNVLGLFRNPHSPAAAPPAGRSFQFLGYELIEEMTHVSAITNCGGFREVVRAGAVNRFGLIADFAAAQRVRAALPAAYPGERHAVCELYEVWRMNRGAR